MGNLSLIPALAPLSLEVPGTPIPQGSLKAFRGKGRFPIVTSDNKRTRPWKLHVTMLAKEKMIDRHRFEEGVSVQLEFYLPRPGSVSPRRRPLPTVLPDLDKLTRAILDALTDANVWRDDAQVTDISASKRYCSPGTGPRAVITVAAEQA